MKVRSYLGLIDDWDNIPWKRFYRILYRVQYKLYKASKKQDVTSIKRLQQVIIKSKFAQYLAVRQVNRININTPLTKEQKLQLAFYLSKISYSDSEDLFKFNLNSDSRYSTLFTLRRRALCFLLIYILEPIREAQVTSFKSSDFGIRRGILNNLKRTSKNFFTEVYILDLAKCFKRVDFRKLSSSITLPDSIERVFKGILETEFITSKRNYPENRLIPIVLDLSLIMPEKVRSRFSYKAQTTNFSFRVQNNILFFLEDEKDFEKLYLEIFNFLSSKGFIIRRSEIQTVPVTKGFNFAGWYFKVKEKNFKTTHYPSKKNQMNLVYKIKRIMKDVRYKLEDRLLRVKIVYSFWINKNFFIDSSQMPVQPLKVWIYKYIRKKSKINKKLALRYVKEIFNWESVNAFND